MTVKIVLGLQKGDEGKAKVFHSLLKYSKGVQVGIRFSGGPNAGHTVWDCGEKYVFHQIPSSVIIPNAISIISRGCFLDPFKFKEEYNKMGGKTELSTLHVDERCPLILPHHISKDQEVFKPMIGTTAQGVGPAVADFVSRAGLLVRDLLSGNPNQLEEKLKFCLMGQNNWSKDEYNSHVDSDYISKLFDLGEFIKPFVCDTSETIRYFVDRGADIFMEGSQGYGLDLFVGNYPYVTSTGTTIGYALSSTGLSHKDIDEVVGVVKPYSTYVGEDRDVDLFDEEIQSKIREKGGEFGATTGRPRKIGPTNWSEVNKAILLNGVDSVAITKVDLALMEQNRAFVRNARHTFHPSVHKIYFSYGPNSDQITGAFDISHLNIISTTKQRDFIHFLKRNNIIYS